MNPTSRRAEQSTTTRYIHLSEVVHKTVSLGLLVNERFYNQNYQDNQNRKIDGNDPLGLCAKGQPFLETKDYIIETRTSKKRDSIK